MKRPNLTNMETSFDNNPLQFLFIKLKYQHQVKRGREREIERERERHPTASISKFQQDLTKQAFSNLNQHRGQEVK